MVFSESSSSCEAIQQTRKEDRISMHHLYEWQNYMYAIIMLEIVPKVDR